jgi:hypothetical protein
VVDKLVRLAQAHHRTMSKLQAYVKSLH